MTEIVYITVGVLLGETLATFGLTYYSQFVQQRRAKKRQKELSAFSDFMLSRLSEEDKAIERETRAT